MPTQKHDIQVLRALATQYAALAAQPVQEERRTLWKRHLSLKPTRTPVLATYGMWNVWCREVFGDAQMSCADPFYRQHERTMRMQILQDSVGDDSILEPWITQAATYKTGGGIWGEPWGATNRRIESGMEGGAWKGVPFIQEWADVAKLAAPRHAIDEEATARDVQRLGDAVGDILPINVNRTPILTGFGGDISTTLCFLRGLEQVMLDMYESPAELHQLLAFMRDGVLANQQEAEDAGDYSLTSQGNQSMTYAEELSPPRPNALGRKRSELWGFCAAQEFTLVSPRFHDLFLYQYQMPIMAHFGLVHYGCCEDLGEKITMLRQLKNLRSIAVTPRANVRRCAEQIGTDYVLSWRPNPADMVCTDWDEGRIRSVLREGLTASRGCFAHVHLKDVETVQGETDRLARWVNIVREVAAAV
jgi:hypothetical protein